VSRGSGFQGTFRSYLQHVAVAFFIFVGNIAHADGPHIAFHETQGAYTVTLFSAPDPLITGPVALTLLVQNAGDGALAPLASASGQLTLYGHAAIPLTFAHGGASGAQLMGATVPLADAGTYALRIRVGGNAGKAPASFSGELSVQANHGQRNTVLWAVFLPLTLILLFLANQYAKERAKQ